MEYDEGERKTKTISFTVYEDDYDAPVEAVLEALINDVGVSSRTLAVSDVLVNAILDLGECRFGMKRTEQIMEEGFRKHQEEISRHGSPPEVNEL